MHQLSEETPDKSQLPWGLRQADSQLAGVFEAEGQPDWSLSSAISFAPEQASAPGSTQAGASSKTGGREGESLARPARRTLSRGDLPPPQQATNTGPTEMPFFLGKRPRPLL